MDLYKGESPRSGETGSYSAPTCEPTWFHIILCPSQTQNKREIRQATPVRRMSRGVDDPRPVDHQGFAGGSSRERRNHLKTCMCPWHMCVSVVQGWYRCLHVSPLACMRSNLEAKVLDLYKGESPRYGETG